MTELQLVLPIDWERVRYDWTALLERQEYERASFIRALADRGASQQEIAKELELSFQYVHNLIDYQGVVERLSAVADNPLPTEWELRPFIEEAAEEVAEERGVERVRSGRDEVYERAAELYEQRPSNVHFSSATDEWSTPQDLFDVLNTEFEFDLDVCARMENTKVNTYYDREMDGLQQRWWGACWMNPPYGDEIAKWVHKAYESAQETDVDVVVCLLPARTDTAWWQDYTDFAEVRFLRGRLKFGGTESSAPFPSAVVIFGRSIQPSMKNWTWR